MTIYEFLGGTRNAFRSCPLVIPSTLLCVGLLLAGCDEAPQETGIRVNADANLITTEAGAIASFNIVLNSPPSGDVVIPLHTDNQAEGLISGNNVTYLSAISVKFGPDDWHIPKIVYVQGVGDNIDDGNVIYHIVTEPALSDDVGYQAQDAKDVQVTNYSVVFNPGEVQPANIIVTPATALVTAENGSKEAVLQVALNRQPSADVTVTVSSLDNTEGLTQPSQPALLVFTGLNWDQSQSITITGVDDADLDGDVVYQIAFSVVSTDSAFNNLSVAPLSLLNEDDEVALPGTAAVIVSPMAGLLTRETAGAGNTATFSMHLNTSPAVGESITIDATLSDNTEASISPASVVFDSSNWQTAAQFTLTGLDDDIVDGDQAYSVSFSASSSDAGSVYNSITISNVQAVNIDDDSAAVNISLSGGAITTSENQTSATISVVLAAAPTADVTISAASLDLSEGSVSPASLTFMPGGATPWNQAQTFTVTGVDDAVIDGTQSYTITLAVSSLDATYNNLTLADITADNHDNDTASVSVILPNSGVVTSENLSSSSFDIVLDSAPAADVTISAVSLDAGEGVVSPASLTFSAAGATIWNQAQSFTVTGVDDSLADGNQSYTIALSVSSTDPNYDGLAIAGVPASNTDNDNAAISLTWPLGGLVTSEDGGSDSFDIVLNSEPSANVTVSISSSDSSEASVSPASVIFAPSGVNSWSTPQTITVTGINDTIVDGDQPYMVNFSVASSDPAYDNFSVVSLPAVNIDNETVGVSVNLPVGGIVTSEALGSSKSFSVVLDSQPSADVTIWASSMDSSEGVVSPSRLSFSSSNSGEHPWNVPRTFTVFGQADGIRDGNQQYVIVLTITSVDNNYDEITIPNIQAVNIDINDDGGD